jgi:hypothetical protein
MALAFALLVTGGPQKEPARVDLARPPVVEKEAGSYKLEPERDGLVYRGPRFDAHVAVDGVVGFTNKKKMERLGMLPARNPAGTKTLQGMIENWMGKRKTRQPAPAGLEPPPNTPWYTPPNYPLVRELCQDPKSNCFMDQRNLYIPQGGARADWEYRLLGIPEPDPAREEKARFLTATAPLRDRMAVEAKKERMKAILFDLPSLLDAIWADPQPAAERRKMLHELWKEFAEMPGNESGCATVTAFIKRRLPAGSPDAFTKKELGALRAAGGPQFDPYGPY